MTLCCKVFTTDTQQVRRLVCNTCTDVWDALTKSDEKLVLELAPTITSLNLPGMSIWWVAIPLPFF